MSFRDVAVGWSEAPDHERRQCLLDLGVDYLDRASFYASRVAAGPRTWGEEITSQIDPGEIASLAEDYVRLAVGCRAVGLSPERGRDWASWLREFMASTWQRLTPPAIWDIKERCSVLMVKAIAQSPRAPIALLEHAAERGLIGADGDTPVSSLAAVVGLRRAGRTKLRQKPADSFFSSPCFLHALMGNLLPVVAKGVDLRTFFELSAYTGETLPWEGTPFHSGTQPPSTPVDARHMRVLCVSLGCLTRSAASVFQSVNNPRKASSWLMKLLVVPTLVRCPGVRSQRIHSVLARPTQPPSGPLPDGWRAVVVFTSAALRLPHTRRCFREVEVEGKVGPTTVTATIALPVRKRFADDTFDDKRIEWQSLPFLTRESSGHEASLILEARVPIVVAYDPLELSAPPLRKTPMPRSWRMIIVSQSSHKVVLRKRHSLVQRMWANRLFSHRALWDRQGECVAFPDAAVAAIEARP